MAAENKDKDKEKGKDDEMAELKEAFAVFDKNGDGSITTTELGIVLRGMNKNFTDQELKKIVQAFDGNGDGTIDFAEFLKMMTTYERKGVDELKEAFKVFDKNGDGSISVSEIEAITRALGEELDRETIELMIKSVDTDGNGVIDFQEFSRMMRDGPAF